MTTGNKVGLLDGDVLLYEITFSCEEAWNWGNDLWTLHGDFKQASQRLDCWISNLKEKLGLDGLEIALTCREGNWRNEIYPDYKANRKSKRKPILFPKLREYLEDTYSVVQIKNLEADDVLGILATSNSSNDYIIVTIDKDLLTVPGYHYNYAKDTEDAAYVWKVTKEQADYNHLLQTITGDPVDNYPGCPGIGKVRGARVLDESPTWSTVVKLYEKAGLTEEDALVQARVARILRADEFDMKTQTVKYWSPE